MFASKFRSAALSAALICLAGVAHAGDDEDPESGQSWLLALKSHRVDEGQLLSGTIRATDDYGATHDRDFRLRITGTHERKDRKLVLNRFEPECFDLAPVAKLTLEDYCDQITVTFDDGDAQIAFSSLDANRRYGFVLRVDPRDPQSWESLVPPDVEAPHLRLRAARDERGVAYDWELETRDGVHRQQGEIGADDLRELDLIPLEASLIALGEVLLTFNRYAFQFADLPREHPAYAPTPYASWAQETTEGGCIFNICFGNLGGGGGAGAGNNSNACSPQSPTYNPALCPHDLTYAAWPLSLRMKIQKIDEENVRSIHFVKNVGPGEFNVTSGTGVTEHFSFVSLVPLFSSVPVVEWAQTSGTDFDGPCFRVDGTFMNVLFLYYLKIEPGASTTHGFQEINCPRSSRRPPGRYRLYVHVDPTDTLDSPGFEGNNIGKSGLLEWVRFRH
jgi:hypothetical protein